MADAPDFAVLVGLEAKGLDGGNPCTGGLGCSAVEVRPVDTEAPPSARAFEKGPSARHTLLTETITQTLKESFIRLEPLGLASSAYTSQAAQSRDPVDAALYVALDIAEIFPTGGKRFRHPLRDPRRGYRRSPIWGTPVRVAGRQRAAGEETPYFRKPVLSKRAHIAPREGNSGPSQLSFSEPSFRARRHVEGMMAEVGPRALRKFLPLRSVRNSAWALARA